MSKIQIEEQEPLKERERENDWSETQKEHQANPVSWELGKRMFQRESGDWQGCC